MIFLKKVLSIIIIFILFVSGCKKHSETNIYTKNNLNSKEPFFMDVDNLYYIERTKTTNNLVSLNKKTNEIKTILENTYVTAVFVDNDILFYAEEADDRTVRTVSFVNLETGEKQIVFSVEFSYNDAIQAQFIKKINNNIIYFDGNDLWVYNGEHATRKAENILGICFYGSDVYYADKNGDLYINNIEFINEYCILKVTDIYDSQKNSDYLETLGGLGIIRNLDFTNGKLYFIFGDKSRNGEIFSYDTTTNNIESHYERFRAESFQIVDNVIYSYGFLTDEDNQYRGYYKLTENTCEKIYSGQKYLKDFLISENILYFIGDDYTLQKINL